MRALTHEQCVQHMLAQNERNFRLCDRLTRETGRLCKLVVIIDGAQVSLFKFDRRFPKAQGAVSHLSAVYYPQVLGRTVMVNPPAVFKFMFAVFSVFVSAATKEKFAVCPAKPSSGSALDCPYLARSFGAQAAQALPPFMGGSFPMPPSLDLALP